MLDDKVYVFILGLSSNGAPAIKAYPVKISKKDLLLMYRRMLLARAMKTLTLELAEEP